MNINPIIKGEFIGLIGEKLEEEELIIKKAQKIVDRKQVELLIISLGAAGIYMITEKGHKHFCSPLTPIKSRVGAGDSIVAGITFSLSKGENLEKSVKYGIAAGAAAVMTPGTELCKKKDVDRLFNYMMSD